MIHIYIHTNKCMYNWKKLDKLCGIYQCQFSDINVIIVQHVNIKECWVKDKWHLPVHVFVTTHKSITILK